jgi:hypothetical protein
MFTRFYEQYATYCETAITNRRFSERTWENLITTWDTSATLTVSEIGQTTESRPIREVRFGQGPIHIIAWSQMHGDEATATMALADIFRFLSLDLPEFSSIKEILQQKISLFVIPRLNADGAAYWTRETAVGIDMNRDAQTMHSQEARILSDWADSKNPLFAFNLHDQNRLYSVGKSAKQTHLAFLATTGDEAGTWTVSRTRAAKLANRLTRLSQAILPGLIAKWSDEFNPRAFGDQFQSRGYGLVLLESGGAGWDLEKQSLRRINAALLLDALVCIANEDYQAELTSIYEMLETNERQLFDIKITDAPLDEKGTCRADIGLNLVEIAEEADTISYAWQVEEIGDLAHMHGLNTLSGKSWQSIFGQKIKLASIIQHLQFTEKGSIAFDLSTFTAKINQ